MMRGRFALVLLAVILTAGLLVSDSPLEQSVDAYAAAFLFGHCVNYRYRESGLIYDLLPADSQSRISRPDFVAAFEKERSYPYLTPLFLNLESVTPEGDVWMARYSQAARLPGMFVTLKLRQEQGRFRIEAFSDLIDGSYLDKFKPLENGG